MRFLLVVFFTIFQAQAFEWRTGDVIVQSFDCMECRLIQSETNSPYVHSGLVIRDFDGELKVAEALGPVGLTSLSIFLSRGKMNTVFRVKEFETLTLQKQTSLEQSLRQAFYEKFKGLSFYQDFLWDNTDRSGKESLYCAEFVAKILNGFLNEQILPQPMSYQKHYDLWLKVFHGKVPDGLPGLSPAYFSRSPLFFEVKE